jgi:hypothetical protein
MDGSKIFKATPQSREATQEQCSSPDPRGLGFNPKSLLTAANRSRTGQTFARNFWTTTSRNWPTSLLLHKSPTRQPHQDHAKFDTHLVADKHRLTRSDRLDQVTTCGYVATERRPNAPAVVGDHHECLKSRAPPGQFKHGEVQARRLWIE